MNSCDRVKPLLYLYRAGELAPADVAIIQRHLATCSRCSGIARDLRGMEPPLAEYRARTPEMPGAEEWVGILMRGIESERAVEFRPAGGPAFLDRLIALVRPALATAVVAACILLTVQQWRDSDSVSALERRLRAQGADPAALTSAVQADIRGLEQAAASHVPMTVDLAAGPALDLRRFFRSELWPLSGSERTLARELERQFPLLAEITPDDGLDERERQILATEGAAFARELEELIHQGERTP